MGDADGARISFDNTSLIVSASKFFLGSADQYISGSNGNIEISSSNFHLDNAGNVIMTGTISANAGSLGGFSIGGGAISSDNFFISGGASGNDGTDDTNLFISLISINFVITAI